MLFYFILKVLYYFILKGNEHCLRIVLHNFQFKDLFKKMKRYIISMYNLILKDVFLYS